MKDSWEKDEAAKNTIKTHSKKCDNNWLEKNCHKKGYMSIPENTMYYL